MLCHITSHIIAQHIISYNIIQYIMCISSLLPLPYQQDINRPLRTALCDARQKPWTLRTDLQYVHAYVHWLAYTHSYSYMLIDIIILTHSHTYTYTHTHTHTHTHIHTYTHTHTHTHTHADKHFHADSKCTQCLPHISSYIGWLAGWW